MITIERLEGGDHLGECEYSITQNGKYLTKFTHNRTDDLKICLQKAADSISKGRWEQTNQIYKNNGGG
jgi:hypothetical protein